MALNAVRLGDADIVHCSTPFRAQGAETVRVNGLPWSRLGDFNTPHLLPCGTQCCPHIAPIAKGSPTVYAEGRNVGRVGDPIAGCTFVGATNSPNVLAG
jgi:uncharacterized Zn-binding protein involved in type VI secretion